MAVQGKNMRLEHYSADRLAAEVRAIVAAHLDLDATRVFFFGSRVRGTNSERSDIDIGISAREGEVPAPALGAIREALDELPTLYSFDVVDFRKASPGFRKAALKEIEHVN